MVPVGNLFFSDAGPHVVSRADRPPTSVETRFRTEITAVAEHLRKLVADAGAAATAVSRDRAAHELRRALRSVRGTLESFGHTDAGRFFASAAAEPNVTDPMLLSSIDTAASLLGSPSIPMADLVVRLAELGRGSTVDRAIGMAFGPLDQPRRTPAASPAQHIAPSGPADRKTPASSRALGLTPGRGNAPVARRTTLTPTGPELHQLLQSGIVGDGIAHLRVRSASG